MITRLEVDVPLVTVYGRFTPKDAAATYFSLSPIGPL